MFEKIVVKGAGMHSLYRELLSAQPAARGNAAGDIAWNFEKFVVARSGEVVARFAPTVAPDDPELVTTLEAELAKA